MSAYGDGRTEAEERADDSRWIADGMRKAFPPLTEAEYAATLPERADRVAAELNERLGELTDLRFEFEPIATVLPDWKTGVARRCGWL